MALTSFTVLPQKAQRAQIEKQLDLRLLPLFVLATCASAQAIDRTDNQQWTDVQVAVPVTKQFDFNILGRCASGVTSAVRLMNASASVSLSGTESI